ncbi:MAG TPA: TlpA disulfide reductase family protein [Halothiobacillus sp.]|nr:TlpA disulfide reductase family protein [Halothiobacillus sp.]
MTTRNAIMRRTFLRTALSAPPFVLATSQIANAHELADPQVTLTAPKSMPPLKFTTKTGATTTLDDFRGKFILLNIWATWCGPCREEMPALDRLQAKLGGPHFQVLPLSIDAAGLTPVQQFYQDIGIRHLGIYLNISGDAMDILHLEGVPTSFFINQDGLQISSLIGAANWSSTFSVAFIRNAISVHKI